MTGRQSIGVNLSILLISTIFGVLLFLPLRLLLNTNYNEKLNTVDDENSLVGYERSRGRIIPWIRARRSDACPKYEYEFCAKSIFFSDYDRNCSRASSGRGKGMKVEKLDSGLDGGVSGDGTEESTGKEGRENIGASQTKSVSISGHILAAMLVMSVIAALVEVLRVRLARSKIASRANGSIDSRRNSVVDLPQRRFVRREEPVKHQTSFETQGIPRPALRLLGARPPPLLRRSSFPTQYARPPFGAVGYASSSSKTSSRRPSLSIDSRDEIGLAVADVHHRSRLIRRY